MDGSVGRNYSDRAVDLEDRVANVLEKVMGASRGFGLATLAEVKLVVLESDGSLSVIPAERKND